MTWSLLLTTRKASLVCATYQEVMGRLSQDLHIDYNCFPRYAIKEQADNSSSSFLTIYTAGLIQDLYLKELKAYKPSTLKPLDSAGQVQKFTPPKPPQPPSEGDIANELKEYETQQVEVEGQAAAGETSEASEVQVDWFEDDLDEKPHNNH